nr:hypothetical protein [Candidatus Krumholzibacteria bacterium]
MAGRWRFTAHPHRDWLLKAGATRFALSPDLGQALLPLQGTTPDHRTISRLLEQQGWEGDCSRRTADALVALTRGRRRGGREPIWLKIPLVPADWTNALAGLLVGLTSWPVLGAMAALGFVGLATAGWSQGGPAYLTGFELRASILCFLGTAFWHELGHAAALRRTGYPCGGVGLGVLFIFPVLYAEVTAVELVTRRDRLRVDLAGVCFQLGAAGVLGLVGWQVPGAAFCLTAGWLALAAVTWSLLPFIRADGYWFLCDALGLVDLDRPVPWKRSTRVRAFLVLHRVVNAGFLILVGVALPVRIHGWLLVLTRTWQWPDQVALVAVAFFTAAAWWGLGQRLLMLYAACRVDLLRLWERSL